MWLSVSVWFVGHLRDAEGPGRRGSWISRTQVSRGAGAVEVDLAAAPGRPVGRAVDPRGQRLDRRHHPLRGAVVEGDRRVVDARQIDHGEPLARAEVGVHREADVDADPVAGTPFVPDQRRRHGTQMGGAQRLDDLVEQRLDDRGDARRVVARRDAGADGDSQRLHRPDRDVEIVRAGRVVDRAKPRLDLGQPRHVGVDLRLELHPPQPQHAVQLDGVDLVEDRLDLLQREPQLLEGHEPVQSRELRHLVAAASGPLVDMGRGEQPHRVVVPQHAHTDPAAAGELSDSQHGSFTVGPDTVSGASPLAGLRRTGPPSLG